MKKIFLALTALVITFSGMAQKGKGKGSSNKEWKQEKKEERKEDKLEGRDDDNREKGEKMQDQLGLTESQRSQMKEINAEFKKQMQQLKSSGNMSDEQVKEKRRIILKERREKIQAILTDEQKAMYKKAEMNGPDRGSRTGGYKAIKTGDGDGLNNMTKDLNLTAEQSLKINELKQSFTAQKAEIGNNTSLTEEQKKDQIKELGSKYHSSIKEILTDEQKKQLKSKMKNRRGGNRVK